MAVKVTVPNKFYNAVFMGVEFKNGEALVEDVALAQEMSDRFGYSVEDLESKTNLQPKAPAKKAPAKKKAAAKKEEE